MTVNPLAVWSINRSSGFGWMKKQNPGSATVHYQSSFDVQSPAAALWKCGLSDQEFIKNHRE
jgi:hypothetical protein